MVNFNLGERFPRPRSQQRGSLCPRARRVAVLGVGAGGGRPLLLTGSGGVTPEIFFEIFDAKSSVWGPFWPENKLIEGQPNECDVICRNGVPPRSRTTTPLPPSNRDRQTDLVVIKVANLC